MQFNPKYSLDNFVWGDESSFVAAQIRILAKNPAKHCSPVYIHSKPGLGKTHILQGLCLAWQQPNPRLIFHYITADQILDCPHDLLQCAILVIDDIDCISGDFSAQVKLVRAMDLIHQTQGKVIISGSDHIGAILKLSSGLRNRIISGMTFQISPPLLPLRIKILEKLLESSGIAMSSVVLRSVAEACVGSVCMLEGAANKLVALHSMDSGMNDTDLATEAMQGLVSRIQRPVCVQDISSVVAAYFQVGEEEMYSKRRELRILVPRQIVMYLARLFTDCSYQTIGRFFNRNHATALHAKRKVIERMKKDSMVARAVEELSRKLRIE